MKSIQCVIVEDNDVAIEVLKTFLRKIPFCRIISTCKDYYEAIQVITINKEIDLIFLDLELEGNQSGLDILRTVPNLPPVIITTNYSEFAVDSYSIGKAADYLVKPFEFDRLLVAVNRALEMNINYENLIFKDNIFLKKGRKFQNYKYDEVLYFEAYGIYLKVISKQGVEVVNETISNLAEKLDPSWFIRVHKSFIINIQKIIGFEHSFLFIEGGKVPIGISYRPQLEGLLRLLGKPAFIDKKI